MLRPNVPQLHVNNHLTGEVSEGENRNVLVEAARICRGRSGMAELMQPTSTPSWCRAASALPRTRVTSPSREQSAASSRMCQGLPVGAFCQSRQTGCLHLHRTGHDPAHLCWHLATIGNDEALPTPSKLRVAVISTAQ